MSAPRAPAVTLALISLGLSACDGQMHRPRQQRRITATTPRVKAVTITQQYVCHIHSHRHIKVRALETGYLEEIPVKAGQAVKEGDLMFKVRPALYQKKLDAEMAEAKLAQRELDKKRSRKGAAENGLVQNEVAQLEAKVARAKAMEQLAAAELDLSAVKAPFDGVVDRLHHQQGSLVEKGEVLTTLYNNSQMCAYFNVPEARYLDYMADSKRHLEEVPVELVLANGKKVEQVGKISAIEAKFDHETGNIAFRADFPNPDHLLRHGQTGNVLIHRVLHDALVIPQRATFEMLDKRYVYVIDKENVAHQREVVVQNELQDIFVIKNGLDMADTIVLEGVLHVRDGQKVEYEFQPPQ
jgi:membrane fusion protein (multidrug efflux system)